MRDKKEAVFLAGLVRSDGAAAPPVPEGQRTRMEVLIGPREDAPNFIMRRFFMEPGGSIPAHKHPAVEHEQYVLRGFLRIGLDAQVIVATAGDAVFIPADMAHWYENAG